MADKAISELVAAEQITATDMFVLEQNNTAKKLTGQVLLNWLTAAADGHGGIQSIVKKSTSGLVDTYRITLADTTTFDFVVTNGRSVNSISKYSTSGLVDTYRISYNDGTTSTFTITNGAKGDKGDNQYVWIKYASQKPTASSHSFGDVPDDWIGIYSGASATAPTDWTQYDWFQIKGAKGDTGAAATLVSNVVEYQVSDSGTIIPSGTWTTSIPVVAQGRYMWTRVTTTFNTGSSTVAYSVSRMGVDGTGSVSSVAGVSPNANGDVPLTADDVGALPSAGGEMTGSINMNGQKITGLNAPAKSDEVATKGYVDNAKPNLTGYATETYVNNAVGVKVDKDNVVNNFTTTAAGYVADARALKVLNDEKLSMELLWENDSPASEFAARDLTANCKSSDLILGLFYSSSTNNKILVSLVFTGVGYAFNDGIARTVTTGNGKISVSAGLLGANTNNAQMIPYRFYLLKGVS